MHLAQTARRRDANQRVPGGSSQADRRSLNPLLFRRLSTSRLVTIAPIESRVRGAGSEFVLACDMRFRARESAIFGQMEPAFGRGRRTTPYPTHGSRASPRSYVERGGLRRGTGRKIRWINRALPGDALGEFVSSLAHRIAGFPTAGHVTVKDGVNAIALAPAEDFRRDSDLFASGVRDSEAQERIQAAMKRGFQTPDQEKDLAHLLGVLVGDVAS
jgi:enoyl-CoA hydratase/carnithine racemase